MVELKLLEEKDCDFIVDWNKGNDLIKDCFEVVRTEKVAGMIQYFLINKE